MRSFSPWLLSLSCVIQRFDSTYHVIFVSLFDASQMWISGKRRTAFVKQSGKISASSQFLAANVACPAVSTQADLTVVLTNI